MADNHRVDVAVLPLAEETLSVKTREVLTGRFRVKTVTDVTDHLIQQSLRREDVEIREVPVGRYLESGSDEPRTITEDGVTIIPVFEEVLVVEKRLMLKHEIHIRHTTRLQSTEVPVSLRKQRAIIERLNSEGDTITDHIDSKETPS